MIDPSNPKKYAYSQADSAIHSTEASEKTKLYGSNSPVYVYPRPFVLLVPFPDDSFQPHSTSAAPLFPSKILQTVKRIKTIHMHILFQ